MKRQLLFILPLLFASCIDETGESPNGLQESRYYNTIYGGVYIFNLQHDLYGKAVIEKALDLIAKHVSEKEDDTTYQEIISFYQKNIIDVRFHRPYDLPGNITGSCNTKLHYRYFIHVEQDEVSDLLSDTAFVHEFLHFILLEKHRLRGHPEPWFREYENDINQKLKLYEQNG